MDVKKVDLTRIHSDELGHLATQVREILRENLGRDHKVTMEFSRPAEAYLSAINEKAPDSLSLAEADARADKAWGEFFYQLQASTRCMNDEVRRPAQEIQAVFEQTDNPTSLNYAAEYGALRILLERLESIPIEKHIAARTELALADLRQTYDDFMAMSSAVNFEASTRVYGVRKETRTKLIEAWQHVCKRLPALVDLNGDVKAADAIAQINVLTDGYRNLIKLRSK